MATQGPPQTSGVSPQPLRGEMAHIQWPTLVQGDDGSPVTFSEFTDRSIQFSGNFGGGTTVVLEGSNDLLNPTNWFTLTDPQGNPLMVTSATLEQVMEATVWVRPRIVSGDGNTSIVAALFCRRTSGRPR
jgi:hypothetical protein